MAATLTQRRQEVYGNRRRVRIQVGADNSYPTGGWGPFSAMDFGLGTIEEVAVLSPIAVTGYLAVWIPTNAAGQSGKLKMFYSDNNNAADGPLIEVPNGTDLTVFTAIELEVVGW